MERGRNDSTGGSGNTAEFMTEFVNTNNNFMVNSQQPYNGRNINTSQIGN